MILPRGEPVEARVGAVMVVVVAPGGDQLSGMAQVGEQVLVHTQNCMETGGSAGDWMFNWFMGKLDQGEQ